MHERLERIYRDHRQGMFTLALAVTGHRDRAEDAVQEAFARLCRRGLAPPDDLVPYAFAAVRNAAIDEHRRQGRSPATLGDGPEPASLFNGRAADPAADAVAAEREAQARAAVDGLPDREKQTVVLRLFAGLTFQQVAETLNEPLGTVTSRYQRTVANLRRHLEELM